MDAAYYWLRNDNGTREFIALPVKDTRGKLTSLVRLVDEVLLSFQQPKYYEVGGALHHCQFVLKDHLSHLIMFTSCRTRYFTSGVVDASFVGLLLVEAFNYHSLFLCVLQCRLEAP